MAKAVFCIARTELQAETIVNGLKNRGFTGSDISLLFPDRTGTKDFAHEQHTKAPEGAVTGASALGIIGGAFGWLVGMGVLVIPGTGAFVAAGALLSALGGAAIGAAVGGVAGGLVGMGIPEYVAKRYKGKIKAGNILISVHAETSPRAREAKSIFAQGGATDIATTAESVVPSGPRIHALG